MNITFCQGNKPCKETKKKRGVGGWEEGGDREEVPCGRYCDSRKGVQTHFADLVNKPCRVDSRSARNGYKPAAGFLFPLRQVQGSRPSRPPPSPLPGSRREPARPRPAGTASRRGASTAPSPQHPFPAPSSTSSQFLLSEKIGDLGSLLLSPQSEGETT